MLVANIVCHVPPPPATLHHHDKSDGGGGAAAGDSDNAHAAVSPAELHFAKALKTTLQRVFGSRAVRCYRDMPLDFEPQMVGDGGGCAHALTQ